MVSLTSSNRVPVTGPASIVSPLLIVILVWSLATLLLTGAALLGNISWITPRLESRLSAMMHRNVTLDRIHWHIGLDRLSIITNQLGITELDGKPFMSAGTSEIGIEPNAFLRGDITMTYLSFKNPEIWAVQLAPNEWNFSDLIWVVEHVSAVRMQGGMLHMVKQTAFGPSNGHAVSAPLSLRIAGRWIARWKEQHAVHDAEDVNLDLVRPRADHEWPVTISFSIPGEGYRTRVSLRAVGRGLLEDWKNNPYHFDITAKQVSSQDLEMFSPIFEQLHGLFDVHARGNGTFNKVIAASVGLTSPDLIVSYPGRGRFNLSRPSLAGDITLNPNRLSFSKLTLRAGELAATGNGTLTNWSTAHPQYNILLNSQVANIQALARLIPAGLLPGASKRQAEGENLTLSQLMSPSTLTGSAIIKANLTNEQGPPKFTGTIDAQGVSKVTPSAGRQQKFSLLSLLTGQPARIKATISQVPRQEETADAEVSFGRSEIHALGVRDPATACSNFDFVAQNLDLSNFSQQISRSDSATEMLNKYMAVPYTGALQFTGRLDLNGKVHYCKGARQFTSVAQLNTAGLALADGSLSIHNTNGQVRTSNDTIYIDGLSGSIGDGSFVLSGKESLKPQIYNLRFRAKRLDVAQANKLLKLLRIKEPLLSSLEGQVGHVDLTIAGNASEPRVDLSASPESVTFLLNGCRCLLTARSGTVQSNGSRIAFHNVTGSLGQGTYLVNGTVESHPSQHYNVEVTANHTDIQETRRLLDTLGLSVPLLSGISGTVKDAHFTISGSPANPHITMVAHPRNVFAQLPNDSRKAVNITGGTVRLDSQNIYYESTVGSYNKTKFVLNGTVGIGPNGKYNLKLISNQADLSDTAQLSTGYGFSIPIFSRYPLSGSVRSATVTIAGKQDAPSTSVEATPVSIYLSSRPESSALRVTAGSIKYLNDDLEMRNLELRSPKSEALADVSLSHVSSSPSVDFIRLSTPRFFLSDLNALLSMKEKKQPAAKAAADFLSHYKLSGLEGVVKGNFLIRFGPSGTVAEAADASRSPTSAISGRRRNELTFQGAVGFNHIGADFSFGKTAHRLSDLSGTVVSSGNSYDRLRLSGVLDEANFTATGRNACTRLFCPWQLQLSTTVPAKNFLDMLPFTTSIAAAEIVNSHPVVAQANLLLNPQSPGGLRINDSTFTLGAYPVKASGTIAWGQSANKGEPTANLTFRPATPIQAVEVARLLYPRTSSQEVSGTLSGELNATGPLSQLKKSGYITVSDLSLPRLAITAASGRVTPDNVSVSLFAPMTLSSRVAINSLRFRNTVLTDVTGEIILRKSPVAGGPTHLALNKLQGRLGGGLITANGSIGFAKPRVYNLDLEVRGIDAATIATRILREPRNYFRGNNTDWQVRAQAIANSQILEKPGLNGCTGIASTPFIKPPAVKNGERQIENSAPSEKSDTAEGAIQVNDAGGKSLSPKAIQLAHTLSKFRESIKQQAADIRKQSTASTGALQ